MQNSPLFICPFCCWNKSAPWVACCCCWKPMWSPQLFCDCCCYCCNGPLGIWFTKGSNLLPAWLSEFIFEIWIFFRYFWGNFLDIFSKQSLYYWHSELPLTHHCYAHRWHKPMLKDPKINIY
jgi:hypothetical protein